MQAIQREIEIPRDAFERSRNMLEGLEGAFERIMAKSLNVGRRAMEMEIVNRIQDELGIGRRVIRERLWPRVARASSLLARVRAGRIGWPLSRFVDPTAAGVVSFPGVDSRNLFHARMPTGHEDWFARQAGWRWKPVSAPRGIMVHGQRVSGLPIEIARTDSITDAMLRVGLDDTVLTVGADAALASLSAETEKVLAGGPA